jgi:hypothetical protein
MTSDDKPQTYLAQALPDEELSGTGRFARRQPVQINGTAPVVAVPGRAPNWSRDPVPSEPPLGFEVDELPQMLTVEHR